MFLIKTELSWKELNRGVEAYAKEIKGKGSSSFSRNSNSPKLQMINGTREFTPNILREYVIE